MDIVQYEIGKYAMSKRNIVALVTGAGSGIGKATALRLAEEGMSIVVNDLSYESTQLVVDQINKKGGNAISAPGDASNEANVKTIIDLTTKVYDYPNVLVNSAGFMQQRRFDELTYDDFDKMLKVHLYSTFLCIKLVLPQMLLKKYGVIINIASQLGQVGAAELCHYSAAKAAIIGLTKSLAREVSNQGVRVNAIAPGPINTPLIDNLSSNWKNNKIQELPLGRFGEPEEIADTVSFLVSDSAKLYVGQTLGPNSGDVMF